MKSSIGYLFVIGCLLVCTGCTNLTGIKAGEIHQTMSYPLIFTETIDATGIKKVTKEDGTVVRKAESATHTTTIFGFTRAAVYKDVEFVEKTEKK